MPRKKTAPVEAAPEAPAATAASPELVTPPAPAVVAPPAPIVPVGFKEQIVAMFDANFAPYLEPKLELYKASAAMAESMKARDAETLALVDAFAKTLLAERDSLEAVRASGPGALNSLGRELGKRFKPLFEVLEGAIANLKHESGEYLLAERRKQVENYQAAAQLHAQGDHSAAQVALATAGAAETAAPVGTSVREVWAIERFEPSLMVLSTPERPGLAPDEAAIKAYLAKLPIGEEPALPGVICKRVPAVVMRR